MEFLRWILSCFLSTDTTVLIESILDNDITVRHSDEDSDASSRLSEMIEFEHKDMNFPPPTTDFCDQNTEQSGEEKWAKHYSSKHKILVVGEGDFSFSASLAAAFGDASNITATSIDSKKVLRKVYDKAIYNIEELKRKGCKVMHGVNAAAMASNPCLKGLTFDHIIFNFPLAVVPNSDCKSQLRPHTKLIKRFLKAAKEMIRGNGEVHITQRTDGVIGELRIESFASHHGLELVESVDFNICDYPGYNPKWDIGADTEFDLIASKTYKFRQESDVWLENVKGVLVNLATTKPASSTVDDVPVFPNANILQCGEGASSSRSSDASIECTSPFKLGVENDKTTSNKGSKISTKQKKSIWLEKRKTTSSSRNNCASHCLKQNDMEKENVEGLVTDIATKKPASSSVEDVPTFPNVNILQCGGVASSSCSSPFKLGVEIDNSKCNKDSKISTKSPKSIWLEKMKITSPSNNNCANHYLKENDMEQESVKDVIADPATMKPERSTVDDVPIFSIECTAPSKLGVENVSMTTNKDSKISKTQLKSVQLERKLTSHASSINCASADTTLVVESILDNDITVRNFKVEHKNITFPPSTNDFCNNNSEQNGEQKWAKHYSSNHKILLVGEGDFSFSASLAAAFGNASNMIATSLESEEVLRKVYDKAVYNIEELKRNGCKVVHGVNAAAMASNPCLKGLTFDHIIFNFPLAVVPNSDRKSQLRPHKKLIKRFLKAAKEMIRGNGEVHIAQRTDGVIGELRIESFASHHGLELVESVDFNICDYPGYNPKWDIGADTEFDLIASKTYKFRQESDVWLENVKGVLVNLATTKPASSTVDDVPVFPNANILQCGEGASSSRSSDASIECTSPFKLGVENGKTTSNKGSKISTKQKKSIWLEKRKTTSSSRNNCASHCLKQNDMEKENVEGVVTDIATKKPVSSSVDDVPTFPNVNILQCGGVASSSCSSPFKLGVEIDNSKCNKDSKISTKSPKSIWLEKMKITSPSNNNCANHYLKENDMGQESVKDVIADPATMKPERSTVDDVPIFSNARNNDTEIATKLLKSILLEEKEITSSSSYSSSYCGNNRLKQNDVGQKNVKVVLAEEKWIKHYSSSHKILLVGEGDFSFSASLAVAFGSASNITATSLDSQEFLLKNYQKASLHLQELKTRGCKVMHGVDATAMAYHPCLIGSMFDRIIFNFPYAGFFKDIPRYSQLGFHQALIWKFLENAKQMIGENGEIHITHKTNGFHKEWNIVTLALQNGLELDRIVDFNVSDYPGYSNKFGFGGDNNFNCSPCQTYMFRLPRIAHMPWPLA